MAWTAAQRTVEVMGALLNNRQVRFAAGTYHTDGTARASAAAVVSV
jgi:hypothetical protein